MRTSKQKNQQPQSFKGTVYPKNEHSAIRSCLHILFSLLPDTLLHCLSCVHLLALHRQLLADTLLMDRPTMQNAGITQRQCLLSKLERFSGHLNNFLNGTSFCFRSDMQSCTLYFSPAVGPARLAGCPKGL